MVAEQRGSFVGPQLHRRAAGFARRGAIVAAVGALLFLTGCSAEQKHEWTNFAMPDPATTQADHIFNLWHWAWVAALIMVVVFFYWTVNTQNAVLQDTRQDHTITVVGQQWSWTFNYTDEEATGGEGTNVYTSGEGSHIPTLVLPVDETTQFNLRSPDVIHSFGIPAFLMRMDVVPGRENFYEVTPTTVGTFRGKCYELCGVYHSRMLFNVEVVSREDFDAHLHELQEAGFESEKPVIGGENARTPAGLEHLSLDEDDSEEGSQ